MKWNRDPLRNRLGEKRVIEKFLWVPTRIGNVWKWLEKAQIEQQALKVDIGGSMEWGKYKVKWRNITWIE